MPCASTRESELHTERDKSWDYGKIEVLPNYLAAIKDLEEEPSHKTIEEYFGQVESPRHYHPDYEEERGECAIHRVESLGCFKLKNEHTKGRYYIEMEYLLSVDHNAKVMMERSKHETWNETHIETSISKDQGNFRVKSVQRATQILSGKSVDTRCFESQSANFLSVPKSDPKRCHQSSISKKSTSPRQPEGETSSAPRKTRRSNQENKLAPTSVKKGQPKATTYMTHKLKAVKRTSFTRTRNKGQTSNDLDDKVFFEGVGNDRTSSFKTQFRINEIDEERTRQIGQARSKNIRSKWTYQPSGSTLRSRENDATSWIKDQPKCMADSGLNTHRIWLDRRGEIGPKRSWIGALLDRLNIEKDLTIH
ncbi:unnamed protein product [Rhodiola kirilowii]